MTPSQVRTQRQLDLLVSDLRPICPFCAEIAEPASTDCATCGARLVNVAAVRAKQAAAIRRGCERDGWREAA